MKSLSITGLILLAVSTFLFYLTTDFTVEKIGLPHIMGVIDYSDESVHPIPTKVDSRFDDDFLG